MTSFILRRVTLVILSAIIGLIVLDVKNHGSFKASKTGKFLKDSGALHYGDLAWTRFRLYSQEAYRWSQKNVPYYITKIRENALPCFCTIQSWLTTLAKQLWTNLKLVSEYFVEKKPLIEQWVNKYAPGLIDTVTSWFKLAWKTIREHTSHLISLVLKYMSEALQWLRENVFVGSLSPENLQRYTMKALNTTQKLAAETFSWLNNKVITIVSAP